MNVQKRIIFCRNKTTDPKAQYIPAAFILWFTVAKGPGCCCTKLYKIYQQDIPCIHTHYVYLFCHKMETIQERTSSVQNLIFIVCINTKEHHADDSILEAEILLPWNLVGNTKWSFTKINIDTKTKNSTHIDSKYKRMAYSCPE